MRRAMLLPSPLAKGRGAGDEGWVGDIIAIVTDLLGEKSCVWGQSVLAKSSETIRESWQRQTQSPLAAPIDCDAAILARQPEGVYIRFALLPDGGLFVLPGSHAAPLDHESREMLLRDPTADLPGSICVRLAAGDALFCNASILCRTVLPADTDRLTIELQAHKRLNEE